MGYFGSGVFIAIGEMSQNVGAEFVLVIYGVSFGLGCLWLMSRLRKRREATATCAKSSNRMKELLTALDVAMS